MADAATADRPAGGDAPPPAAPKRRHAEILAPLPPPLTPAVRRRAWRALVVLLAIAVLAQPLSVPAGHYLFNKLQDGTDINTQWRQYVAGPAPDVLFLGPSEARTDVDRARLSALLSAAVGRPVSVGTLGVSAEQPAFLDVLMYRVMERSSRPKLIVNTLEAPMFNPNAVCRYCEHDPLTTDLWQLTDYGDPGFLKLALENDPSRLQLLAGWVMPALANYPSIAAVECPVVTRARRATQFLFGSVPWELQLATPCEISAASRPDHVMTAQESANVADVYRSDFVSNYAVSPQLLAAERDLIRRGKAGGTQVVLLRPPFHSSIRSSDQAVDPRFLAAVGSLSTELDVPVVDLSQAVPDDPSLWVDPIHLNRSGAQLVAPQLAAALAGALT
ncbi:MAG TPA: hypothetical protein VNG93_11815 [Candidatus Dormibacteraeota bacterium]|nr:hypothetical protein [Candidatus Dormibacteraeota bacterium]